MCESELLEQRINISNYSHYWSPFVDVHVLFDCDFHFGPSAKFPKALSSSISTKDQFRVPGLNLGAGGFEGTITLCLNQVRRKWTQGSKSDPLL